MIRSSAALAAFWLAAVPVEAQQDLLGYSAGIARQDLLNSSGERL